MKAGRDKTSFSILFWLTAAAALTSMLWLSQDFGITWDEWMDHNNGLLGLRFTLSLGQDLSFMQFWHGYLYSHFFYSVTGLTYTLISPTGLGFLNHGLHAADQILPYFEWAHRINAAFGWAAMLFAALTARRIGSWRTALIAFLILFLSPRFFGNSMNNPKDIPFAAAYMASLYFILRCLDAFPRPPLSAWTAAGVAMGIAMGTRIGGVILWFYFAVFSFTAWFQTRRPGTESSNPAGLLLKACAVIALAYMTGLLFWPYGMLDPLRHLGESLAKISDFKFWNHTVLFNGEYWLASELPWYYLPEWIAISTPEYFLIGILAALCILPEQLKSSRKLAIGLCWTAALFPLAVVIIKGSIVYDSWRHLFFIYPPLAVLSAAGWDALYLRIQNHWPRRVFIAASLALLLLPLTWMIRNHPNQTVYFNHVSGGLKQNFSQHESDYWCNAVRRCASFLAAHVEETDSRQSVKIRSDCGIMCSFPYLKEKLDRRYLPYGYPADYPAVEPYFLPDPRSYGHDWDYWIRVPRGRSPQELAEAWPPAGTIFSENAEGEALCAVIAAADK